jgi:hypothetical protein
MKPSFCFRLFIDSLNRKVVVVVVVISTLSCVHNTFMSEMMRLFLVFSVILGQHLGDCWAPQSHLARTERIGITKRPFWTTLAAQRPSVNGSKKMSHQVEHLKMSADTKQKQSPELFVGSLVAGLVTVAAVLIMTMANNMDIRYV